MDYQGMEYLIQELQRFDGAVIIISHDRYFLDKTVTQIAEIEKGKITMYPGNYSDFRAAKQQLWKVNGTCINPSKKSSVRSIRPSNSSKPGLIKLIGNQDIRAAAWSAAKNTFARKPRSVIRP